MTPTTESRMYAAAFLIAAVITVVACSYCDGRTDEAFREHREMDQQIANALAERDAAQERYDLLVKAAGEGAVLEAGIEYQQAREGGR